MASKTNVEARKEAKQSRPKPKGACGHTIFPVLVKKIRGAGRMRWYCETDGLMDGPK